MCACKERMCRGCVRDVSIRELGGCKGGVYVYEGGVCKGSCISDARV